MGAATLILPVAEGDGEGDRLKAGGGAIGAVGPSTALRAVPLPMRFAHREERRATAPARAG
jgi:hypothetical protein